jgi:hypothetical protein
MWYSDPGEVRAFAHILYAARKFRITWDVLDYGDHPEQWSDEHKIWVDWGRPAPFVGACWDLFARDIADILSITEMRYAP